MIVCSGLGSSLIVTQGYGRKYLSSFCRIGDFEKSLYKFLKDNYTVYPVYYGSLKVDVNASLIWLDCNFSELNVETGHFSYAYIDVVTRLGSVDEFNSELRSIVDELRELFRNADIDLYDFTYPEHPQQILDAKIVVMDEDKRIYERVEELEFTGYKLLLQASQMTIKAKLLENFSKSRIVNG